MPPARRHMQDFACMADAFYAARRGARFSVEAEQPLGDGERGGDFGVVEGGVDAGRGCRVGEHDPVFGAKEDGVPGGGGVGVFVVG